MLSVMKHSRGRERDSRGTWRYKSKRFARFVPEDSPSGHMNLCNIRLHPQCANWKLRNVSSRTHQRRMCIGRNDAVLALSGRNSCNDCKCFVPLTSFLHQMQRCRGKFGMLGSTGHSRAGVPPRGLSGWLQGATGRSLVVAAALMGV